MELRSYAGIIQRRWLTVLLLPLVALIVVVALDLARTAQHTSRARVSLYRLSEQATVDEYEFDDYYDFLASDFLLDDTVEIIRGNVFAAAVTERLAEQGIAVDPSTVETSLDASREHRILTISSTTNDSGLAVVIANVASTELREDYQDYVGVEGDPLPVTLRAVDIPTSAETDDLQVRLTYAILVVVAAGLGLLLALLLEYFDESLTAESAAAALELEVLGEVRENRS